MMGCAALLNIGQRGDLLGQWLGLQIGSLEICKLSDRLGSASIVQ